MSTLLDIKYALRLLFKSPKFTAMTLLVLIGGLSISLFTFSFLYSVVYKPLPLKEGDTAKSIGVMTHGNYGAIMAYEFQHIKDHITSLAEFGVYDSRDIRVSVNESGKSLYGNLVHAGFFEFSRTAPILGRTIQAEDTKPGAPPVALISYNTWQNDLNGREDVLTRTMILNGEITQIIGVMPQGYHFPNIAQIWLPLPDDVFTAKPQESTYLSAYGRLAPGKTIEQAESELSQAVNQVYQQNVKLYDLPELQKTVKILSFPMAQTGGQGGIIFAFLNAVSWGILLLACINVGNLLLARTIERQKETAIRAALGATTARLVSQLMWEGIIIATLGGVLSLLLVGAALEYTNILLQSWLPGGISFWWQWGMDFVTFMMGLGFIVVTIVLSALLPAWRSANQDINATLRDGTRGAQGKKAGKVSRFLVTAQVFLVALLMLIGSISAFVSYNMINLDMGDNYDDVMSARFLIPENKYPEKAQQIALFDALTSQIKQHPNVEDVVSTNWHWQTPITMEGQDYTSENDKPTVDVITLIGNTETIGINLVSGRQFSHMDKEGNRKTAIISQSMAKRYWPGESPLEKSFTVTFNDKPEKVFIVGVVTDRLNPSTLFGKLDTEDEVYLSGRQFISAFHVMKYKILPQTANPEEIFYRAMFNTDRNLELLYAVQPANENRNLMRDSMRLMSNITFATGFFALLLAMVGIYGLTANTVAQRTHEVGIRRAVGATDRSIIALFIKQGVKQLVIGLGLALVIFALMSVGFHSFTDAIFPVHSYFTLALLVVVGLTSIVLFAVYVPTKRAVMMEPSMALRYE